MTYGFKMANSVTDLRVTGTVCASVYLPSVSSFEHVGYCQPNLMNW